jgi:acyl-CoA synthetase (AMP-forming)/AMP-acid ligase II/acetyltransferase-like isoleucine patch superfamily enzyme
MITRVTTDEPAAVTVLDVLKRRAQVSPEALALLAPQHPPLTYRRLLEHVEATVEVLHAHGLNRNDRVAVVLPNGPEIAVAFAAVAATATCAPLNPAYRQQEFDFSLTDLGARALIVDADVDSPAQEAAHTRGIPVLELKRYPDRGAGIFEFGGAVEGDSRGEAAAAPQDTALVLHTSGTTARPKVVPLTQQNLCMSAHAIASTLRLTPGDRCINIMPLFHIHGLIGALLASWTAGASVVATSGLDPDTFFGWLETFCPTWYTGVPTMHQAIVARAAAHRDIIPRRRLRFIRSCSAALPSRVMAEMEVRFMTQVIEAYGMTEASHQIASNPLDPLPRKPGSVGLAAGAEIAIMDASGRVLPVGAVGEVVIRGAGVIAGYENNPAANASSFTDGWFRTGDQGRLDDEGYLFLSGRLKEIINRGGEKVAPAEIDTVLMRHPAVHEAVAFAVPHPTLGEDVAAAIVLKHGATATEHEIRRFAAGHLSEFKIPKRLLVVGEIPRGPTGKLQRLRLAERLAEALSEKQRDDFVAPQTPEQTRLCAIWESVLHTPQIGVRDDFYALGGDSLALAVMTAEVEASFQTTIPLDAFLSSPTIETLAALVPNASRSEREDGTGGPSHTPRPSSRPIRDSRWGGFKNRLLQLGALYAPGYTSTRVWLHRLRGVTIGQNVSIGLSTLIETAYPRLVTIGDNVTIGMRVVIIAHLRDSTAAARTTGEPTIRIEDGAYIGPGVIILPHVTIGAGAVVSAGSVVSRSIPAHTLARGNPAQPIARCGVSLGGGVAYEEFLRHLTPVAGEPRP